MYKLQRLAPPDAIIFLSLTFFEVAYTATEIPAPIPIAYGTWQALYV